MDPENDYRSLLDERAQLVTDSEQMIASARSEGRGLTETERQRDEAIHTRLSAIKPLIVSAERSRDARREMTPATAPAHAAAQARVAGRISDVHDRAEDDPRAGFANIAEFAIAVKSASRAGGYVDPRLNNRAAPTNGTVHTETGGGTEGYLVPTEMRQDIWDIVFPDDVNDIVDLIDFERTNAGAIGYNADATTPWGAAGIQAYWRGELEQMDASKLQFENAWVRLHSLFALTGASDELLQDLPRLNDRLTKGAGRAIRWKIGEGIVWGNGTNKPLGWMVSPALVTVAKEGSQTAKTINAQNIANMYARLVSKAGAFWMINPDVLPQLITLTLGDQPIFQVPNGFVGAPQGYLLGLPIRESQHAHTLGTLGDIQLINPEGYLAAKRTEAPQYAESIHLWFDYGATAFRWMFRVGGQPFMSQPISPARGSSTQSYFVTLATRA